MHLQQNLNEENEQHLKLIISVKEGLYKIDRSDIICIEAQNIFSNFLNC